MTISNITTINNFYKVDFEFFYYFQLPVNARNEDGSIR